jgi:hypothetical protein
MAAGVSGPSIFSSLGEGSSLRGVGVVVGTFELSGSDRQELPRHEPHDPAHDVPA